MITITYIYAIKYATVKFVKFEILLLQSIHAAPVKELKNILFSSGFEPETFRVLGGCDNQLHHENSCKNVLIFECIKSLEIKPISSE